MKEPVQKESWKYAPLSAAILSFLVFVAYVGFPVAKERLDERALILFFASIGCFLLPVLKRLKIGQLLELETRVAETEAKLSKLFRGEVVKTDSGEKYYIDSSGKRYSIPDESTAQFLASRRGEIVVSENDIERYRLVGEMDSVIKCRIIRCGENGQHFFAVLNEKKYHISDWVYLMHWGREKTAENFEILNDEDFQKIPLAR